jgi:tetratricopeptide (TPR) repeat protein
MVTHGYITRHLQRAPLTRVFWLRCDTESRFIHDYSGIATHVDLPGVVNVSDPEAINDIRCWLSSSLSGRWIIVVDDVDEEILNRDLLSLIPPNPKGSVILTTQSKTIAEETASNEQNVFEVKALEPEDAKIVLLDLLTEKELCPEDDASMSELIRRLAYHPLAISHAGCYINNKAVPVPWYLQLFETTSELVRCSQNVVEPGQRNNPNRSGLTPIAITLMISFGEIQRLNSFAAEIMSLVGCLASQNIPRCLLTLGYKDEDSQELNAALELLKTYSFITGDSQDQYFDVLDTVYLQIRQRPHPGYSPKQWMKFLVPAILQYFPPDPFLEASNSEMCDRLLPHAEAVLNYPCADVEIETILSDLANRCCRYLQLKGCHNRALRLAKDSVSRAEKSFGEEDPRTLTIQAQFAILLREMGDLVQARELNEKIVAGRSKTLGEDHPDTLCSLNSLASVIQSQGYYDRAEAMHRLVLDRCQRVLGLGDAQTLRSMHNLAFCLQMQLQYNAAEEIGRRVVSLKTELLGHDSLDTASSISNLAIVLQNLGKLESAIELHQKVLKVREDRLGKHHPLVLQTRNNIAGVWYQRRHFVAAEKEIAQVLELNVNSRGRLHPESLTCIANLSALLETTGKLQEAEKLAREVLQGREKVFGTHHPSTVESRQALQRLEKNCKAESASNV